MYAVGREKIKEYARAVGETNPVHLDVEAARAAGYADVVAPPMFAVVYSAPSVGPPIFDPEIDINFPMMVHGGAGVRVGPPGGRGRRDHHDRVRRRTSPKRDGRGYYVFESSPQPARRAGLPRHLDQHRTRSVSMADLAAGSADP